MISTPQHLTSKTTDKTTDLRLFIHDTQDWHDLYSNHRTLDPHKFLYFYCKDAQNEWDQTSAAGYEGLSYSRPLEEIALFSLPWMQSELESLRLHLSTD